MPRLPRITGRRGSVLVVATTLLVFTAQSLPAYAGTPKIKTKLTSATSIKIQKHGAYYIYGAVTDGSSASTALQDQLVSVSDQNGFTAAEIAAGPTTTNSFTTSTLGHELVGARIPAVQRGLTGRGFDQPGPGSSLSTSVSFSVTSSNSIVEVIGLGSSQQTSSLSGVPGFTLQATSTTEAVQLADATNLTPGPIR